jgi:hypothetical protein
MRKAAGIVLTALGAIGLSLCGIVLLRVVSIVQFLSPLDIEGFHIHPIEGPLSSAVLLTTGVLLLRSSKAAQLK